MATHKTLQQTRNRSRSRSLIAEHEVLRNTYCLLGISLIISAITAGISMVTRAHPGPLLMIAGMYGLLFLVQRNADNVYGLLFTFAFTGFMGYTLGPILNLVVHGYANGTAILMNTTRSSNKRSTPSKRYSPKRKAPRGRSTPRRRRRSD